MRAVAWHWNLSLILECAFCADIVCCLFVLQALSTYVETEFKLSRVSEPPLRTGRQMGMDAMSKCLQRSTQFSDPVRLHAWQGGGFAAG